MGSFYLKLGRAPWLVHPWEGNIAWPARTNEREPSISIQHWRGCRITFQLLYSVTLLDGQVYWYIATWVHDDTRNNTYRVVLLMSCPVHGHWPMTHNFLGYEHLFSHNISFNQIKFSDIVSLCHSQATNIHDATHKPDISTGEGGKEEHGTFPRVGKKTIHYFVFIITKCPGNTWAWFMKCLWPFTPHCQ